ncbi:ABC transporter substrate-binding protein [Intrasporangium sp.]|uniref:ABC transporter substrate-binding protein n=1 Tax=Intrasporangium sp. TaxID=1925024 RepID=UPI0029397D50|nr:ABC transporter substrate-binding protein [Intrasporangium sp.]MDV3221612.1 ABC transporter substrate-binding protein [Intrasporangium sp.]
MKFSTRYAAVATMAAAALALSACGGAATEDGGDGGAGAGGDTAPIKLGIIADRTGATGDVGSPYNDGMLGYIDWINAKGGIKGRQIDADSNDYAYKVPTAEELYKKYVNDEAVAIQGWGTGDSEALRSKVAADKLPFMSASYAEPLTDPKESPYNFVVAPTYSDQMRVALNWIAEDAGGKADVAVFHNDSPFGLAPVADGQTWISEKGLNLGYKAYPMPKTPNFVGLLTQAKSQGAKYIVIQNVSSPAAQVAKDIKAQGLDMKIVCLNWCADELFIKTAGADSAEGHILVQPFAPASAQKPGHAVIDEYLKSKGSSLADEGLHYAQGWYTMDIMAKGIEKAIDAGGELTGEAIKSALETMGPVDTGGVVGAGTVEFSADSHRGSTGTGIYEVKGGDMVELAANQTPES